VGRRFGDGRFLVTAALALFVFRVGRTALILSFLGFYAIATLIRAYLIRWHMPPEVLILGALTSPRFYLFTFYMITDPKTSMKGRKEQILWPWPSCLSIFGCTRGNRSVRFSMRCS